MGIDLDAIMESPEECSHLSSPSYLNFALSILILLGILLSYIVQHIRIIQRRSSEGISPYFVLLGTTSSTSAFANILALPASRVGLDCCRSISGFECFAGLLGIVQVGTQWICFAIILLLFLLYFPHATALAPPEPPEKKPSYKEALGVTGISIVHAMVIAVLNLVMIYKFPQNLQHYADVLGVMATILASIQYLPQLWTTFHLKHVGSLSIPMMCIQTPGSFVWAGSLYARVGLEGWSTWATFLVTGSLQGCVLAMGLVYEFRNWRRRKDGSSDPAGGAQAETNGHLVQDTETTPLLRDSR